MKWLWIRFGASAVAFLVSAVGFFVVDKPPWVGYLVGMAMFWWLMLDVQKDMEAERRKLEFRLAVKRDGGRINVLSDKV